MRIAIVTESFAPDLNGVAHSVVRTAEHLLQRGHHPLVIAPAPAAKAPPSPEADHPPYPLVRVPSVRLPSYQSFRLGLPTPRLSEALLSFAPDVVHLASPFVLGAGAVRLATQHRVPSVAVYQTDVAAYARAYQFGWGEAAAWHWLRRIHNAADRTLAPSSASATDLTAHGVRRIWRWPRGVDTVRFTPAKRSAAIRRALAPGGETLVGYVGRLAREKRVDLLTETCQLPGVRVVVVGDGPARPELERTLPGAVFLGSQRGERLARIFASLDVFAHTGPYETFGQSVQEAMASGLPVVAPARGGPVDLVDPGVTGTLVPPGDPAALAAAVATLVTDHARRRSYALAARTATLGRSWTAVGDELIGHYTAVTGVPATSPARGGTGLRLAA